jgi:hypothetical protein
VYARRARLVADGGGLEKRPLSRLTCVIDIIRTSGNVDSKANGGVGASGPSPVLTNEIPLLTMTHGTGAGQFADGGLG